MSNQILKNFFVFEGCEGSGKSTQASLAAKELAGLDFPPWRNIRLTKEPGGTSYGDRIRHLILFEKPKTGIDPITEFLLFEADRREHINEIKQRHSAGDVVICDRFSFSTFAYQGYGRGLFAKHRKFMELIDEWIREEIHPRLVFLFDQDVEIGLLRKEKQKEVTSFEREELDFHKRVRRGFLEMCQRDVLRWHMIDANKPI